MTARSVRMQHHALTAQELVGGLWVLTCSCGRGFCADVKDDAQRAFEGHQDVFDGGRWEQPEVPMIPGHEQECVGCGALLYIIGDRDALCNRCEGFDPDWNAL